MRLAKRQQELAETRLAEALGRPEKRCPDCSELGAHWVAGTLDEHGAIVRGYFTCAPAPVVVPMPSLLDDLDGSAA